MKISARNYKLKVVGLFVREIYYGGGVKPKVPPFQEDRSVSDARNRWCLERGSGEIYGGYSLVVKRRSVAAVRGVRFPLPTHEIYLSKAKLKFQYIRLSSISSMSRI